MPIPVPPVPDNTIEQFAANKILRYNQAEEQFGQAFIGTFEDFWGVQWPPQGSRHTTAEMQAIINAMPQASALQILQSADKFVATYGAGLPERYHTPAFEVTIHNGSTIVVGNLKVAWQAPVEGGT
jgi:hypothetical protein